MTGEHLIARGFSTPVSFRLSTVAPDWREALPKTGYGVFVILAPDPVPLAVGQSDIVYIGGAFSRGGLRARLDEYWQGQFREGSRGWKRVEHLCGEHSPFLVSYLQVAERQQAVAYRDDLIREFESAHHESPKEEPRRVTVPRTPPRRVLRVTRDILVPPDHSNLVYVMLADRPVNYEKGESRIVYIGTTRKGVSRAAVSAVENAPRIFSAGGSYFDVVAIAPPRLPDTEIERDLERALVRAFQLEFGIHVEEPLNGPLCNDHGPGKVEDREVFRHFKEAAARRKIRDLSRLVVR